MNQRAVSLVELLVSVAIGSVLVLMACALSELSLGSHRKVVAEHVFGNDVAYAFKFMRNRVRTARDIQPEAPPNANWIGQRLLLMDDSGKTACFGIYESSDRRDFVFLPDASDASQRQVLMTVMKNPEDNDLNFSFSVNAPTLSISIQGEKDGVGINYVDHKMTRRVL